MYIVLPTKVDGLEELVQRVDSSTIHRQQFLLTLEEVKVSLPKFNIVNTVKLNDILKSVNILYKITNAPYIFIIHSMGIFHFLDGNPTNVHMASIISTARKRKFSSGSLASVQRFAKDWHRGK